MTQSQFLWLILLPTYVGAALLSLSVVSKQVIRFSQPIGEWLRSLPAGLFDLLLWPRVIEVSDGTVITNVSLPSGAFIGAILYAMAWLVAFAGRKLLPTN